MIQPTPASLHNHIISALAHERRSRKLTLCELARRAGVSRVAISHIEARRRKPSLLVTLRLLLALEMDAAEFFRHAEATCPGRIPENAPKNLTHA